MQTTHLAYLPVPSPSPSPGCYLPPYLVGLPSIVPCLCSHLGTAALPACPLPLARWSLPTFTCCAVCGWDCYACGGGLPHLLPTFCCGILPIFCSILHFPVSILHFNLTPTPGGGLPACLACHPSIPYQFICSMCWNWRIHACICTSLACVPSLGGMVGFRGLLALVCLHHHPSLCPFLQ